MTTQGAFLSDAAKQCGLVGGYWRWRACCRSEGIVNLCEVEWTTANRGRGGWISACSGSGRQSRDLAPGGEAGLEQLVVLGCGEEVPAGTKVVRNGAERTEELLRVLRRFEALEHAFSAAGRAVGILRPIVQPLVPPVLHPREHLAYGRRVAGQFVGDHDP